MSAPPYRHVFKLADGETVTCDPRQAKRTLDKRHDDAPAQTVWEVETPSGLVRRLWPEDVISWTQEPL